MSRITKELKVFVNKKVNKSNTKNVENENIAKAKNYYNNLVNATVVAEMGGRSRQAVVFSSSFEEKAVRDMINKAIQ